MAIHGDDLNLQMEEVLIPDSSTIVGKNIIESELRPKFNLIIIAIKKRKWLNDIQSTGWRNIRGGRYPYSCW